MNTHIVGKDYENKALHILNKQGFDLCCKNYRGSLGEIDLIVKKDNLVVFVEVKFRKNSNFGRAIEAVNNSVKLNVPLGVSVDFGNNYAEIH